MFDNMDVITYFGFHEFFVTVHLMIIHYITYGAFDDGLESQLY